MPDVHGVEDERRAAAEGSRERGEPRFRAESGTLYVVATPLGNLRDVTLRALDILATADVVAAEDTRVTSVMLRHYGIATRALALHAHNEAARAEEVIARLRAGASVALVSDAGTPAVSDPGARVVRAVRDAGLAVVPIPGANAAVAAISAAGLVAERFVFLGFAPSAAKARRELVERYAQFDGAIVLYEAPHRVRATVAALAEALDGQRDIVIARELTKKFETIACMPLAAAPDWLAGDANRERGEFVLIVDAPAAGVAAGTTGGEEAERLLRLLLAELPPARAARIAAQYSGQPRDALYARASALKK